MPSFTFLLSSAFHKQLNEKSFETFSFISDGSDIPFPIEIKSGEALRARCFAGCWVCFLQNTKGCPAGVETLHSLHLSSSPSVKHVTKADKPHPHPPDVRQHRG